MFDQQYILTLNGPNGLGIVSDISTALATHGGDILESAQFDDRRTGPFFVRIAFDLAGDVAACEAALGRVCEKRSLKMPLWTVSRSKKALILASKLDHCLGDLLFRMKIGEHPMDVVGIVSNHSKATQDVGHVAHADGPDELVRKGRDIERRVPSRAVTYHLQRQALLVNGTKTSVFALS